MKTLTSLLGNSQRLDGGAMFGNAPKAVWSKWLEADDHNRVLLACRALLVREPSRMLLFETGIGAFFPPKLKERYGVQEDDHRLLASLGGVGLTDEDIDVVVLSHLHFDHAGGLLAAWQPDREPRLLFPHAQYVVSDRAWERARSPHPRDRASFVPDLNHLLEQSGRLRVVQACETHPLGPGYRFHLSEGHTPGLMLAEIDMPGGPVVFAGDLIPGTPWVHVPITMGYDRYPELLIDEKERLLTELWERQGRLFYTHDVQFALSGVGRDERGRFRATAPVAALEDLKH